MTDSANLDLVRSIYAEWERGDFTSAEWAHPGIEYVWAEGPSPGRWKGVAAAGEGFRVWTSAWDGFRIEAHEYHALDGERVLVLARFSGRGKRSGLELGETHTTVAQLFHVRDGKVTRFVTYFDHDRALTDLGLDD